MPELFYMPQTTLVVFALETEAQGHFDTWRTTFCGVGKVNASYRLMRSLSQWMQKEGSLPRLVINAGSAGSSHFPIGSVVNCTRFIQRDMDVTALDFEHYATPFDDTPVTLSTGLRCEAYPEGICGTGDSFATKESGALWNVVDMEAYALAKVCHNEGIPFCCLKYITDGANDQSAEAWEPALTHTARVLSQAVATAAHSAQ